MEGGHYETLSTKMEQFIQNINNLLNVDVGTLTSAQLSEHTLHVQDGLKDVRSFCDGMGSVESIQQNVERLRQDKIRIEKTTVRNNEIVVQEKLKLELIEQTLVEAVGLKNQLSLQLIAVALQGPTCTLAKENLLSALQHLDRYTCSVSKRKMEVMQMLALVVVSLEEMSPFKMENDTDLANAIQTATFSTQLHKQLQELTKLSETLEPRVVSL